MVGPTGVNQEVILRFETPSGQPSFNRGTFETDEGDGPSTVQFLGWRSTDSTLNLYLLI